MRILSSLSASLAALILHIYCCIYLPPSYITPSTMSYHLSDASSKTHHFVDKARVQKEIGCAFAASLLVSPLVAIIDKAIVQEISGISSLMKSMGGACKEMVFQPKAFLSGLPFRLTFVVYLGTFAVANLSEAALDHYQVEDDSTRKAYKVSASTAANVSLLAWRDSLFARAYAANTALPRTPIRTLSLFGLRDLSTMFSTFYVAPKACDYLVEKRGWDKHQAEITTSLSIPVISQFLTAPIHIHALDYFNRPVATTGDRLACIKREFGKVSFARGLRILPAFGIGSYSNNQFRELFIKQTGDTEIPIAAELKRRASSFSPEAHNDRKGFSDNTNGKLMATSSRSKVTEDVSNIKK